MQVLSKKMNGLIGEQMDLQEDRRQADRQTDRQTDKQIG
jgi:hypothetical protein